MTILMSTYTEKLVCAHLECALICMKWATNTLCFIFHAKLRFKNLFVWSAQSNLPLNANNPIKKFKTTVIFVRMKEFYQRYHEHSSVIITLQTKFQSNHATIWRIIENTRNAVVLCSDDVDDRLDIYIISIVLI